MAAATYGALIRVVSAIRGLHGGLWGSPDFLAAAHHRPCVQCPLRGASSRTRRPVDRRSGDRRGISAVAGAGPADRDVDQGHIGGRQEHDAAAAAFAGGANGCELERLRAHQPRHLSPRAAGHRFARPVITSILERSRATSSRSSIASSIGISPEKRSVIATRHLLVDRFRFDSFAPDSEEQRQLLARHGKRRLVYYLFMITPPEKTVERAWKRGLVVGRYKPVDDLLAHNVDAYAGMQSFFLARALHPGSRNQHYEFVDNDVPMGEVPLTVAFGSHGEFNVLDVKRLVDMDRYCKINVDARRPEDLYPDARSLAVENNVSVPADLHSRVSGAESRAPRDRSHLCALRARPSRMEGRGSSGGHRRSRDARCAACRCAGACACPTRVGDGIRALSRSGAFRDVGPLGRGNRSCRERTRRLKR